MFIKGRSGNPRGRKVGTRLAKTLEIQRLAAGLFTQAYWRRVAARLEAGTIHPTLEAKLLAYAYGEPRREDSSHGTTVNIGFLGTAPTQPVISVQTQPQLPSPARIDTE